MAGRYEVNGRVDASEQAAWNLSSHDIMMMGSLWSMGTSKYLRGDIRGAFFDTSEIRNLIHNDLKADEDSNLDELTRRIDRVHRVLTRFQRKVEADEDEEDLMEVLNKITKLKEINGGLVNKYRRYLRELMGKYGYLMAKKEDETSIV